METPRLRVLICIPQRITLYKFVYNAYKNNGYDVVSFDALNEIPRIIKYFYHKTLGLPIIKKVFYKLITYIINKRFKIIIQNNSFNHLFIYNSEFINSFNIKECRKKAVKIIYYLGDSIFYTNTFDGNIDSISYSDIILSPDSFWCLLIENSGIRSKVCKLIPGPNPEFVLSDNKKFIDKVVFVGSNYPCSEGHKRAGLLDSLSDKLVLYGNSSWMKWIKRYPSLKNKYKKIGYLTDSEVSEIINIYKLSIVDANSGIVSGIHQRLLDISQTNCLPLVEYRYEIEDVVGNADIVFKNTDNLLELVDRYLTHEDLRLVELEKIRNHVKEQYSDINFMKFVNQ